VVTGVDDPVEDRLADDRVGEQRVPVLRAAIGRESECSAGSAGPLGEQLVEVVGLGGGELPHREIIDDQQRDLRQFADPGGESAVGVPASELGEEPGARGERDVVTAPAGLVSQRCRQMAQASVPV
jgi:hypothetical protein